MPNVTIICGSKVRPPSFDNGGFTYLAAVTHWVAVNSSHETQCSSRKAPPFSDAPVINRICDGEPWPIVRPRTVLPTLLAVTSSRVQLFVRFVNWIVRSRRSAKEMKRNKPGGGGGEGNLFSYLFTFKWECSFHAASTKKKFFWVSCEKERNAHPSYFTLVGEHLHADSSGATSGPQSADFEGNSISFTCSRIESN